ncbi:MAG: lysine-2,3-aminomutase-like protein [Proteobacteria bacterium]|nr:lysine-2,3-aminomutase-like protein [Pseudomonadota bacterium]MDA1058978.1 lysine-2,3-aminomutase-like protein [Pseudomonadota bacterium]
MTSALTKPTAVLRDGKSLVAAGLIDQGARAEADAVARRYAVAVTPAVQVLIDPTDPADPIARQFLPSSAELKDQPDEDADPIGDDAFSPVKGIVHRYPDRVLLKLVHTCPVYCRYCFRRERVGQGEAPLSTAEIQRALDYVRARPDIWEVILTGGDPFVLSSRRLRNTITALDRIDHLGVVRIHTRVPIADPDRIDDDLVAALSADKAVYVVIHCNHAHELSTPAVAAIRRIVDAGIPVLAQSVLLKGVNDDAASLEALFRALVRARVKPYYLHHPDRAPGTTHFRPSLATGRTIVDGLQGRLSGLCQPTYVLDIPGGHGKVPVAIERAAEAGDGAYVLRDRNGHLHDYRDNVDNGS